MTVQAGKKKELMDRHRRVDRTSKASLSLQMEESLQQDDRLGKHTQLQTGRQGGSGGKKRKI